MPRRLIIILSLVLISLCALTFGIFLGIPALADRQYGPPNPALSPVDRFEYSARLIWYGGMLTQPLNPGGAEQSFTIEQGEGVPSIAIRLEELVDWQRGCFPRLSHLYRFDTLYRLATMFSPVPSIIDIARELQDATPEQVTLSYRPARMKNRRLPATSGLKSRRSEFGSSALRASQHGRCLLPLPTGGPSIRCVRPISRWLWRRRGRIPAQLALHLTADLRDGFARQGLDVYQAVTLASIVQREAVVPEERAQIASVFYNRLRSNMKLDSDPTVQYAVGFDLAQASWWTNPLSAAHLQIDSPYNTYLYTGLPPGPISNPSLSALQAVAFPAETPYYYFRARCDDSGLHDFSVTFEEHLQNGCP
jgi:UPF0755 protein